MLAVAQWHRFLAVPNVAWAQSSLKCAEGDVKARISIPARCLTRGSHCSSTR